ncbi:MAG: SDR family NAD(P)-dependent oxidoreductase [Candidatus Aminicenantes bacterium]|nr:SDR family NAD(P)-dependent oxidoreductase [Candidatus Aminicenantes bacterium]
MAASYTLVTGGSTGIGEAFARACAKRGRNLLLVALPGPELEATAESIRAAHGVEVRTLGVDLAALDGPSRVFGWCVANRTPVDFLINNAGAAGTAVFETSALEYSDLRIMVNVRALVLLSRLFIPMLKDWPQSYILNIGSLGGFYPIPFKSVYSASKAFVLNFSRALREELRNTSIQVSIVCPNGVETNPGTFVRIGAHGRVGRWSKIDRHVLAEKTLEAVFRGKAVIVPKAINKVLWVFHKVIPASVLAKFLRRRFDREVKVS